MASKFYPTNINDVMVIRKVTENITTISTPFARFGTIKIGGRGTIVRLQSGNLAVFSPTVFTPEVKAHVATLGTVKYITAPDLEHHINLGPWSEAYPDAKVLAPEGLKEKRAKQGNEDVRIDVVFTAAEKGTQKVDPEWDAEFDTLFVPEHGNKEIVVNYRRDKTLIEADLLFNLPAIEQYSKSKENPHDGFATKMFIKLNNTAGTPIWQRRFIWMINGAQRDGFNKSIAAIDKWDFNRIIPCHGDVIETQGKHVFRNVMQWHLDAVKRQESTSRIDR